MSSVVQRIPGPSFKRSLGSAAAGLAFAVATAENRESDLLDQARASFAKIDRTLESLGSSKEELLSVTIYLAELADKAVLDQAWGEWISDDPSTWPQRCCVGAVLAKGTLVEVVAIAGKSQ